MTLYKTLLTSLLLGLLVLPASWAAAADDEEPGYSRRGADTCLGCHKRWKPPLLGIFQTKHGNPHDDRAPFGERQLQCEACHGPGGAHTGRVKKGEERPDMINFGQDADTPIAVQNGMCLNCHEGHVGEAWAGSAHDMNQLSCADCHSSHAPKDPMLAEETQDERCYACHIDAKADFYKPYAHPVRQGKLACTDCHSPHGSTNEAMLVRNTLNETCYGCHAEKRGPLVWEHAPVQDDCSNCHDPHGAVHPGMLTQRPPLLCQSCHSPAGHPSVAHTPGGLPEGSASAYLLSGSCLNCHQQVHGSNHPSGKALMR
ncbi:MAG: DmsE family decaheme c-type cytochrome [Gammaproteobacteria bacterium]